MKRLKTRPTRVIAFGAHQTGMQLETNQFQNFCIIGSSNVEPAEEYLCSPSLETKSGGLAGLFRHSELALAKNLPFQFGIV